MSKAIPVFLLTFFGFWVTPSWGAPSPKSKKYILPADSVEVERIQVDFDEINSDVTVLLRCVEENGDQPEHSYVVAFKEEANGLTEFGENEVPSHICRAGLDTMGVDGRRLVIVKSAGGLAEVSSYFQISAGKFIPVQLSEGEYEPSAPMETCERGTLGLSVRTAFFDDNRLLLIRRSHGADTEREMRIYRWTVTGLYARYKLVWDREWVDCGFDLATIDPEEGRLIARADISSMSYFADAQSQGDRLWIQFRRCSADGILTNDDEGPYGVKKLTLPNLEISTQDFIPSPGHSNSSLRFLSFQNKEDSKLRLSKPIDGIFGGRVALVDQGAYRFDPASGKVMWHWQPDRPVAKIPGLNLEIFEDGNRLYFVSQYSIDAVDDATGRIIWRRTIANPYWPPNLYRFGKYLVVLPVRFLMQ